MILESVEVILDDLEDIKSTRPFTKNEFELYESITLKLLQGKLTLSTYLAVEEE